MVIQKTLTKMCQYIRKLTKWQFFSLSVSWHDINLNNQSIMENIKGRLHGAVINQRR